MEETRFRSLRGSDLGFYCVTRDLVSRGVYISGYCDFERICILYDGISFRGIISIWMA